ncbi:ABC transporter substrate-binding protein [Xylophilus rhododendri]|uniref:ABC transporter substrate-binding protein n=1 Tax=Xylophilus rhododendri TaxID=2697032 RepID=A0A857JFL5_9BURK|nr:ABC transporter substrate-binding protein [Xylophilus rhododendri]
MPHAAEFPVRSRRQFLEAGAAIGLGASLLSHASWAADSSPVKGGTLVANVLPEPAGLVAGINISQPAVVISASIFDGLVRYDKDFKPQPQLAESWSESKDGKTITFKLRRGVKWHDGHPFTSADVQYSLLEVVKKVHPRGSSTFGRVTAVETPDEHTVVLRLDGPSVVLWSALFGTETQIVPKHLYAGTNVMANPWNTKPVGTGAFVFKEWVRGSHVVLERNPNYWDSGKPLLDRVVFKFIPDAGARAAALESGELHYAVTNPVPESDVERLRRNPALVVDTKGWEAPAPMFFIDFNMQRPQFQDVRIRRAFAHALDRKALADNIWYGLAKPAEGPVPSYQKQFFKPGLPQYAFDPAQAEKLFDEAGLKRGADGVRLRINHMVSPYGPVYQRAAEYTRQALGKVGVELTLVNFDLPTWIRKMYTDYDFDTAQGWYSAYPDPQIGVERRYWSQNIRKGSVSSNAARYSSTEMDRIIQGIHDEADVNKRRELIGQMQQLAQVDVPSINLLELNFYAIYSKRLQGLREGPLRFYSTLADAWLAPPAA